MQIMEPLSMQKLSQCYPTGRYIQDHKITSLDDTLAHRVVNTMLERQLWIGKKRIVEFMNNRMTYRQAKLYAGDRLVYSGAKREHGVRADWLVCSVEPCTYGGQPTLSLLSVRNKKSIIDHITVCVFTQHSMARILQRHVKRASEDGLMQALITISKRFTDPRVIDLVHGHCDFIKIQTEIGTVVCARDVDGRVIVKTFYKEQ